MKRIQLRQRNRLLHLAVSASRPARLTDGGEGEGEHGAAGTESEGGRRRGNKEEEREREEESKRLTLSSDTCERRKRVAADDAKSVVVFVVVAAATAKASLSQAKVGNEFFPNH